MPTLLEADVIAAARSVASASCLGRSWGLSECLRHLRQRVAALDHAEFGAASSGVSLEASATEPGNLGRAAHLIRRCRTFPSTKV